MRSSPGSEQAEWGRDTIHAHPDAATRPAAGRHRGALSVSQTPAPALHTHMIARGEQHGQSLAPQPL
eukprot:2172080-Prymnesium_polylepis.1